MRTTDQFVDEARLRAVASTQRKHRSQIAAFSAITTVISLIAVVGLAVYFSTIHFEDAPSATSNPAIASVLTTSTIGGYVLVAVLSLVLGVAATLLCVQRAGFQRKDFAESESERVKE